MFRLENEEQWTLQCRNIKHPLYGRHIRNEWRQRVDSRLTGENRWLGGTGAEVSTSTIWLWLAITTMSLEVSHQGQ